MGLRQRSLFLRFVRALSNNWRRPLPRILEDLQPDVDVNLFFKLEREVTFGLASLVHDVNELQKEILAEQVDVSPFVSKLSHAFLPSVVYQLEEYGLPRMIAKKAQVAGVFNFESSYTSFHEALDAIVRIGPDAFLASDVFTFFDSYIVRHFFSGVQPADIS